MTDYAFLTGRPEAKATFWRNDADEELAYACAWVPIAWLALFESDDVLIIEEPADAEGTDDDRQTCPTLIRKRESALESFRRRLPSLEAILPAGLVPQLRALESAVDEAASPYLQVIVTDIDLYISFDDSDDALREQITTLDGDNLDDWRSLLSCVQGRLGTDFSQIQLPAGAEVECVVGYLSEQFSIPYTPGPPFAPAPVGLWFTRNTHTKKGWHSFVRPGYVKLLLCIFAAAIAFLVWQ